ncbi:MAG: hypothetical protein OEM63_14045 [Gammaproteobacteria bacterium]|nr:hypothetical protein [Gammaproteobacteria bacterium]
MSFTVTVNVAVRFNVDPGGVVIAPSVGAVVSTIGGALELPLLQPWTTANAATQSIAEKNLLLLDMCTYLLCC